MIYRRKLTVNRGAMSLCLSLSVFSFLVDYSGYGEPAEGHVGAQRTSMREPSEAISSIKRDEMALPSVRKYVTRAGGCGGWRFKSN
ncbi:MAG: hypothetical protein HY537_16405 [Deltaproteobacteria bacterium]|nr:hypothetical protein [Deltaproteobacteria bacterium]